MKAEIIAVGSELLTPDRIDTNSLFLTAAAQSSGHRRGAQDRGRRPARARARRLPRALDRVELVVASRRTWAYARRPDARGRRRTAGPQTRAATTSVLQGIEARFRRLGRTMPEVNKRQAMVPEGADLLENSRGTAPGLWLESAGASLCFARSAARAAGHVHGESGAAPGAAGRAPRAFIIVNCAPLA